MVLKIGHRGACGYEPENTLISFKKALELKVDIIELDTHICKTGELVVIHDETINRTTNGTGPVAEKTLDELKMLDAGNGEKIPALQEVLDLIRTKARINIELKGKNTAKSVYDMIKNYINNKKFSYDDFLISSFDEHELKKFGKLCPEVKISIISKNLTEYKRIKEKLAIYSINLSHKTITKKIIEDAHLNNLKVFAWTVNEIEDIKRMKSLGVDGIFSDFPDRI